MKYIDLFAGAGGLSEGFIKEGFVPVAHVEMDEAACFSLKTRIAYYHYLNSGKFETYVDYLKGNITRQQLYKGVPDELISSVINLPIGSDSNDSIHKAISQQLGNSDVDLIIGGPPCQAYSVVGRARSANAMKGDPRNYLYVQYGQYLEKYKPKIFVFENVLGLKSAKDGLYLKNMEKLFFKKGYNMRLATVEANDFGVLQNRKRVIILGWHRDLHVNIPVLEDIKVKSPYTVNAVFADLPFLNAGEGKDKFQTYTGTGSKYLTDTGIRKDLNILTQHVARPHTEQDKEIYRIAVDKWNNARERLDYNDLPERLKTHQNRKSFFDRFKVVAQDLKYSQTVVAHIAKDGHYYIHPDIEQNRSITVREAARLQSFPDDYYFEGVKDQGARTAAFRQIGNAVPPLMAQKIANSLKGIL